MASARCFCRRARAQPLKALGVHLAKIHVLSPGFETPNARAFLYPLIVWRDALRDTGFACRIYNTVSPGLDDCDVLLVDSKFHRDDWQDRAGEVVEQFAAWAGRCRVIYCDTTDSSGWLQSNLLSVVHGYAKAQLLKDRARYLKPIYAHRPHADYYHREFAVCDESPEWSAPVKDAELLRKLRVSWNSGLADHSLCGPLLGKIYQRIPFAPLLKFPQSFTPPYAPRVRALSCRFGATYPRASVSYQRRKIREIVGYRADTRKLKRRGYFKELKTSRVIVSPFGYGEITLKDFEVFLTGGVLFKPDMSHMETWPDLFSAGETMLAHSWDLSDFAQRLEDAIANYGKYRAIAAAGQDRYRKHIADRQAAFHFIEQFRCVIA